MTTQLFGPIIVLCVFITISGSILIGMKLWGKQRIKEIRVKQLHELEREESRRLGR